MWIEITGQAPNLPWWQVKNMNAEEIKKFNDGFTKVTHVSDKDVRGSTHGDYSTNSEIAQHLKSLMHGKLGWSGLNPAQKESLDLIATKIARILAGNPDHADHWNDIEGYARLAKDRVSE